MICNQERDFENLNEELVRERISLVKREKENRLEQEFSYVKSQVNDNVKRCLDLNREKGAGSWLTALPIQAMGYVLNKQDFRDSLCLRYGWRIANTPLFCCCKQKNDIDHALTCKKGGYVSLRHDRIRDLEADILKGVCKDVRIEPELLPVENAELESSNLTDKSRLDVSAVGVWSPMERTFLDVRIVHPNAPSYKDKSIEKVYDQHEKEKKRAYNQRIMQIERATFTPLVFSTTGGMAPECTRYHKKIAELISNKTKEEYSKVMSYVRTRVRFTLLKSTLLAIRGERGRPMKVVTSVTQQHFPRYAVLRYLRRHGEWCRTMCY